MTVFKQAEVVGTVERFAAKDSVIVESINVDGDTLTFITVGRPNHTFLEEVSNELNAKYKWEEHNDKFHWTFTAFDGYSEGSGASDMQGIPEPSQDPASAEARPNTDLPGPPMIGTREDDQKSDEERRKKDQPVHQDQNAQKEAEKDRDKRNKEEPSEPLKSKEQHEKEARQKENDAKNSKR